MEEETYGSKMFKAILSIFWGISVATLCGMGVLFWCLGIGKVPLGVALPVSLMMTADVGIASFIGMAMMLRGKQKDGNKGIN